MAYSAAETRTGTHHRGIAISLAETEGSGTSEATLTNLPLKGRVVVVACDRSSGDASLVNPVVMTSSGGSGRQIIAGNCGPEDAANNRGGWYYETTDGTLYYRSQYNAGTNNAGDVLLLIVPGWY